MTAYFSNKAGINSIYKMHFGGGFFLKNFVETYDGILLHLHFYKL